MKPRGLLLCGGESSRFGRDKALLELDGQTLLQRNVRCLSAVCSDVSISCREHQRKQYDSLPVEVALLVDDSLASEGPAAGLLAAHAQDPLAHWLCLAVDFPLVEFRALEQLLSVAEEGRSCAFRNAEGFIEPLMALWSPQALARLVESNGSPSFALRLAQKADPDSVVLLEPTCADWLVNTNTQEEWETMLKGRRKAVSYAEALQKLLALAAAHGPPLDKETITLLEASAGRITARSIYSSMQVPPFRNSAMDGIVLHAQDAPSSLRIRGTIAAGHAIIEDKHTSGDCFQIMTGAPLPPDLAFNAVVPVEHYDPPRDGVVELGRAVKVGQHVREAGEDLQKGRLLVAQSTRITAAHVAPLAACGLTSVEVLRRLKVGVMPTGLELVSREGNCAAGQIHNSNGPMLSAFLAAAGCDVRQFEPVEDDLELLGQALDNLPADLDALILTGGVSAGLYDLVPKALGSRGAEFCFRSVAMRPGHPVHAGVLPFKGRQLAFFALPGNPLAALACLRMLVMPYLRARQRRQSEVGAVGKLLDDIRKPEGITVFKLAKQQLDGYVQVLDKQGSGQVGALLEADCWVVAPPGPALLPASERVTILPLNDAA